MEAGHAAQNICLQAAALNLGMVTVGAFYDERVKDILDMASNEVPLYVIPVGQKDLGAEHHTVYARSLTARVVSH